MMTSSSVTFAVLLLVNEAKRSSRGRENEICIQRIQASIRTRLFLYFYCLKTFSVKNEVFEVLKTENDFFY